jgi:hypothetical protein
MDNVIIILSLSILFCLFLHYLQYTKGYTEGMKNEDDDDNDGDVDEDVTDNVNEKKKKRNNLVKKNNETKETIDEKSIKSMQSNYKELMTMQSTIIENMSVLEKSLTKADNIIHRMSDKIVR